MRRDFGVKVRIAGYEETSFEVRIAGCEGAAGSRPCFARSETPVLLNARSSIGFETRIVWMRGCGMGSEAFVVRELPVFWAFDVGFI